MVPEVGAEIVVEREVVVEPELPPVVARPRFSVVVPAYDEEVVLGACLDALAAQTYAGPFEVVVVDNASTDRTADVAREHGARVVHEARPGVCFARQRGFETAHGEVVVTTDADTTSSPGWLQHLDDELRRSPDVVAVAGPCAYVDGPWWSRTWGWLLFGFVAALAAVTGRVVYVTATNLAFRRDAFTGYDTRLTQGGDELDVLRRLRRVGRVRFVRAHATRTSARRLSRGLLHSLVVSLLFHYVLGYVVNRVAGRPLVGSAPAYRGSADESVPLHLPASTAPVG